VIVTLVGLPPLLLPLLDVLPPELDVEPPVDEEERRGAQESCDSVRDWQSCAQGSVGSWQPVAHAAHRLEQFEAGPDPPLDPPELVLPLPPLPLFVVTLQAARTTTKPARTRYDMAAPYAHIGACPHWSPMW
jgi:hypothetical protein